MTQSKYRSKLDKEQKKKKELAESEEYLKQVDISESQGGGSKFVVDKILEEEKSKKRHKDNIATSLQSHKNTYLTRLAAYGQAGLETIDWDDGWERYCLPTEGKDIRIYGRWFKTKIGIQVIIKSPEGQVYLRGVLASYDPEIDIKNIDTLVTQAENTLDSYKGLLLSDKREPDGTRKTKGGIYIP